MREVYYVYNNEAIASCIYLSILDKITSMDIARCCLVLPFLLDDRTVGYLKRNFSSEITLEEFINQQPRLFVSFNKRYLSLLPVNINSLMILYKGNKIKIQNDIISKKDSSLDNTDLGERFTAVQEVIPSFLTLIEKYTTEQLYKILKVQL